MVMPAGVHDTLVARAPGHVGSFVYGQCVDVGAQDDGAACVATALDAGQNAGAGNAAVLYAESRKLFGDEACGLLLLERQFGERMQVAAEFDRCHKSLFLFLVMVRGAYLPTMPLRADMYSGVVPQHPPTQSASPRSRYSDTTAANAAGVTG